MTGQGSAHRIVRWFTACTALGRIPVKDSQRKWDCPSSFGVMVENMKYLESGPSVGGCSTSLARRFRILEWPCEVVAPSGIINTV
jgi:hypothetical protein